jgi:pre-mRNA-processing factor 17
MLLRSYHGHSKAIRDATFNQSGSLFYTASYDRNVRVWDTETGDTPLTIPIPSIPYCVAQFQDSIFIGCSDKRIIEYDARSGKKVLEYNQHLGSVNSITFFGNQFVSTSDDKTHRVWDVSVPVANKCIAQPWMHSMPTATLSPNQQAVAFTSLDNQILLYSTKNYKLLKKRFKINVSGYACRLSYSHDNRFLACGDGNGNINIFDYVSGDSVG